MGGFGTYNLKIFTLSKIIFCLLIFFNVFNYRGEGFFFTGKGAILEIDDGIYTFFRKVKIRDYSFLEGQKSRFWDFF